MLKLVIRTTPGHLPFRLKGATLELIAFGNFPEQQSRIDLSGRPSVRLGRAPRDGWEIAWDQRISREQAEIVVENGSIHVQCLPNVTNRIFYQSSPCRECVLKPGESCRIGETTFKLVWGVDENLSHVEALTKEVDKTSDKPGRFVGDVPQEEFYVRELEARLDHARQEGRAAADEVRKIASQKAERSVEAQLLREQVVTLEQQIQDQQAKRTHRSSEPAAHQKPELTEDPHVASKNSVGEAAERLKQRMSDMESIQLEMNRLQEAMEIEVEVVESARAAERRRNQLEQTNKRLLAENKSRRAAEKQLKMLQQELAALQRHMEDMKTGQFGLPTQPQALETHLGLDVVKEVVANPEPTALKPILALGEYELLQQIANSRTGQVIQARHERMNRFVAIKLQSTYRDEAESLVRFQRRMRIISNLDHLNLAVVHDAGEIEGVLYMVTEFVKDGNLVHVLKRLERLAVKAAVHFIMQAAAALQYAHSREIVHRNINPSHLLMTPQKSIKIIGWGAALFKNDAMLCEYEAAGSRVGTPDYIAPEQIESSGTVDARADVYGLGCTLYALLTKQVMYGLPNARRKLLAHRHQPAPRLQSSREDIPTSLEYVFQTMVEKDPADRFQSMQELREALAAVKFNDERG